MSAAESAAFAEKVVPLLREEVEALHRGDAGPRKALWSRREPVTVLGAWLTALGSSESDALFDHLTTVFRGSSGTDYEVLAAECSGDLGYVVGLEHSTQVIVGDEDPRDYTLRVTTIFRREEGAWKVVHRHGDELAVTALSSAG